MIRDHVDFIALGNALASIIHGLPQCPIPATIDFSSGEDHIVNARNVLQDWLTSVLFVPGARENPAVRQFLCYGANIVPPQFEGVSWISFTSTRGEGCHQGDQGRSLETEKGTMQQNVSGSGTLDEMEMDDMFGYEEGDGDDVEDAGAEFDSDSDADYFSATIRYQPADEAITEDDIMEMQQQADEVEMVEDVGSLAQSLGASHLGRSLQLQAQHAGAKHGQHHEKEKSQQQGLRVGGGPESKINTGGIGGAMEQAQSRANATQSTKFEGLGDSFDQRAPVSQPRLDSFKMIKVIGKGSFGKVFLVREIKTGEMFALKVLRKDNIVKRNQVEHTRTERSVLGYVKHPFIVGLNMAFQSKDKLYFVLDYCAGGELFFHLSKVGRFAEPRARFYASEIVLAISYVHELDIIYRDLKPENVLLDARGHVRLTDFGLSKEGISSSSSGATSFCGTPEYLAPEILNRQGHGRAVDWWSLGALLYEMLTGLPPFYCRDREKLFEKIRKGHLDYPRSLSSRAVSLLRGLLTKDPRRRLGSGPNDAEDIKLHHFFTDTDWRALAKGEIAPPWNPPIQGSLDTSQFDDEFTSMPMFSPGNNAEVGLSADLFEGFTFTSRKFWGPGGNTSDND